MVCITASQMFYSFPINLYMRWRLLSMCSMTYIVDITSCNVVTTTGRHVVLIS